jgi:hypothetical protein
LPLPGSFAPGICEALIEVPEATSQAETYTPERFDLALRGMHSTTSSFQTRIFVSSTVPNEKSSSLFVSHPSLHEFRFASWHWRTPLQGRGRARIVALPA